MTVLATGVGAGTRDPSGRPNVVRLVLGRSGDESAAEEAVPDERAVLLETNVDDLDPRVWPDVVARLLGAGALDAWLTPVLAKKGRPAQTLHVLARPEDELALAGVVLEHTSTLGVRRTSVGRYVLDRSWTPVPVLGGTVRVKIGTRDGRILHATPEYEDAAALARERALPVAHVLKLAEAAAIEAGLLPATSVAKVGSIRQG